MLHTILQGLPELSLILITAVATHFLMSLAQTLMHYALGHHPIGGKFFRNQYRLSPHILLRRSSRLANQRTFNAALSVRRYGLRRQQKCRRHGC